MPDMGIIILYPAFLCTAPCKGNKLPCSTRGAGRVEEDESSLLDGTASCKGNKLPCSTWGAGRVEEDESSLLDGTALCRGNEPLWGVWGMQGVTSRGRRIFST